MPPKKEAERTTINVEVAELSSVKEILRACIKAIHNSGKSRELSLAATKAQEARMWIEEHQANA